jgi:hypothetical protein
MLFPGYSGQLMFGVLSSNGLGLPGYGDVYVTLRNSAIQHRATVFETNSYQIANQQLSYPDLIAGFVSTLSDRHILAVAKSAHLINEDTVEGDFSAFLLSNSRSRKTSEFMEVQIYGPIQTIRFQAVASLDATTKIVREAVLQKAEGADISISEVV